MIRFKQKEYTIQEGHYTGPKDLPDIPSSLEVIGKTTLGGATVGGVVGGVLDKTGVQGASISEGISVGGKTGFWAGVAAKFLLNALHKPMKKVEFQEVDKMIRAKFGVYRVSGFTVGDTLAKRNTIEDKFKVNDRNITAYKISFCIRDNQVTMYTLGISDDDLEKLNSSLDYYCKKFSGMSYTSKPINPKSNSYSVTIVFTNYRAISDFIFEVSEVLGYRINLLDNDSLLEIEASKESQKEYSVLDKYDLVRIATGSLGKSLKSAVKGPKVFWSNLVANMIAESIAEFRDHELAKYYPTARKNLGNSFLEDRLKNLRYIEAIHYTKGLKKSELNIRLDRGVFMVTSLQGSKSDKIVSSILPEDNRKEMRGQVNIWTLPVNDRREFDILLTKLIGGGAKPNIFI